jgi:hypothetical protein
VAEQKNQYCEFLGEKTKKKIEVPEVHTLRDIDGTDPLILSRG